jgi:hypothetical protein
MAEETQQDGQKTLVAFVVGLLIGGMLVWAFSGPSAAAPTAEEADDAEEEMMDDEAMDDEEASDDQSASVIDAVVDRDVAETPTLAVGNGDIEVPDQPSSRNITLDKAVYPVSEGWIGVREYNNEQLGFILGVVRFSESQGLIPETILLQRPTTPGREYAIVIFTEDGDFDFSLAGDVQIDQIFDTFKAE